MNQSLDNQRSAIAIADAVANKFIRRAAPVCFRAAQSPAELEAVYRLRYQVVIERGWAYPEDFPTELEQDIYDGQGLHLIGQAGATIVATTRLIFPDPGRLLPTEAEFGLRIEPQGRVVDGGRAIVSRAYSGRQHHIFAGLLGQSWFELKARGFYYLCGLASAAMIRLCRSIGYQITILGPARQYWGEWRHPIRFDVLESTSTLWAHWGRPASRPEDGQNEVTQGRLS